MPAINQDVEHWIGDSKVIKIPVKDTDGQPVDLSGATARWWLGRSSSSKGADVLVKKGIGSGLSISSTDGLWSLSVTVDPVDTQPLRPGIYYHEAEVIDADGGIITVTTGNYRLVRTMITPE